jgi:hypothetical protein
MSKRNQDSGLIASVASSLQKFHVSPISYLDKQHKFHSLIHSFALKLNSTTRHACNPNQNIHSSQPPFRIAHKLTNAVRAILTC